jgi:formate-dependent nitrite reductase cytochrome c552 subunit
VAVLGGGPYAAIIVGYGFSPKALTVGYQPVQPISYSHELHAGQLGIDCRYCHTTVENNTYAAIPHTQVCISCHNPDAGNGIRKTSNKLAPLFESYKTGKPVEWVKVHDLPDYVYFNHSAHVNKGIGCASCHGRVDKMEVVYQAKDLSMSWCLDCHRKPEKNLRPISEMTNMSWTAEGDEKKDQHTLGLELKETYNIHSSAYLTSCSTCHR